MTDFAVETIKALSNADKQKRREAIQALEHDLSFLPQEDLQVRHVACGDVLARELFIPKGTMLTGAIHKFDHVEVMAYGDMTLATDSGEPERLQGYHLLEGQAGKKRAALAHEDTMWITFHNVPTDRDLGDIRAYLTCDTFESYDAFQERLQEAIQQLDFDRG